MAPKTKAHELRQFEPLKAFDKDWEKLAHSGRHDLTQLKVAMALLLDHPLQGGWDGHRECHIGGDWRLIYRLADVECKTEQVIFCRIGSHLSVFGSNRYL